MKAVRNQELKWERKEMILLTNKKRTENRRKTLLQEFSLHKGFLLSQKVNAQFTMITNLPLSYLLPLFISNKPL